MPDYQDRSFRFSHTISRLPASSITQGLRAHGQEDPSFDEFLNQHTAYINALQQAGVETDVLPALEQFPDAVFVEDAALCLSGVAVILRPGAVSRFGEAAAIAPHLGQVFNQVIGLKGKGYIEGGDILLTDREALIGLSERTDLDGVQSIEPILTRFGYTVRIVDTPEGVLHFKSDSSLLDSETIFSTKALAAGNCFEGYRVILTPDGEEESANLIRVNDYVIMRTGFPKAKAILEREGYVVLTVDTAEAAKVDGGLSCMSLRFSLA